MPPESKAPRILLLDIETAPIAGYTWEMFDANVISVETPTYMLSFSYSWLDETRVYTWALPDFELYNREPKNDRNLVKHLHKVLDEADVVIGHHLDSFDIRKSNARFIVHGLGPPSPYKTVDTLKIARKHFRFDSNKLDSLGQYLGVGRKVKHTGIHLWMGCLAGDPKSWRTMKRYNGGDIVLLRAVYLKLRGWATSHVDLRIYTKAASCPTCQSGDTVRQGFKLSKTRTQQQWQCRGCGAWFCTKLEAANESQKASPEAPRARGSLKKLHELLTAARPWRAGRGRLRGGGGLRRAAAR